MATKRKSKRVRSAVCGTVKAPNGRTYTAIPEWASFVVVYTTPIVGYTGPNVCVEHAFDSREAAESWATHLATTLTGDQFTSGFVLIYAMGPAINRTDGLRTFCSECADCYRCIDPGNRIVKDHAIWTDYGVPLADALTDREAAFIRSLGSGTQYLRDAKSRKLIPALESRGLVQSYKEGRNLLVYATTWGGFRARIEVAS